jgi:hypothetical protein
MKLQSELVRRTLLALPALALIVGVAGPALLGGRANAAQVTSRSIQLSDSAPSSNGSYTSGTGSGTNVTYKITYTPSSNSIKGIIVDICANTPLVGDTSCTLPAGFTWDTDATPAATISGGVVGTWTPGSVQGGGADASHPQVLTMTNSTGEVPSGPITITVTGVTNPNATNLVNHHFSYYARIITFDDDSTMLANYGISGTTRTGGNTPISGMVDYGGAALSIQEAIQITARVMETMALCTSRTAMTAGCAGATSPAIDIGQDVNGTIVLGTARSTTPVYSQISSNATNGYGIYMKARYACGGLSKDAGATCEIPPVNGGAAVAAAISNGDGEFGAQVGNGTAAVGGSGTNTAVARWAQVGTDFLMDTASANDGVDDTYGSQVISSASEAPVTNKQADSVNNTYTFGAATSSITPAGIYSQAFTLVAVGVF